MAEGEKEIHPLEHGVYFDVLCYTMVMMGCVETPGCGKRMGHRWRLSFERLSIGSLAGTVVRGFFVDGHRSSFQIVFARNPQHEFFKRSHLASHHFVILT